MRSRDIIDLYDRVDIDDWREWIARWLRENGITAERVSSLLVARRETPKSITGSN